MLKIFQVSVTLTHRALRGALYVAARRIPCSGAAAGRALTRQLCSTDGRIVRSCTVDPNLEEQFVFLECTGEIARLQIVPVK